MHDILITNTVHNRTDVIRPFPPDPQLIANETFSLCENDAQKRIRVRFLPVNALNKPLVTISTDGLSNSYVTEDEFKKFVADIAKIKAEEIKDELRSWIEEVTQKGSGDDITVGILSCKGDA